MVPASPGLYGRYSQPPLWRIGFHPLEVTFRAVGSVGARWHNVFVLGCEHGAEGKGLGCVGK